MNNSDELAFPQLTVDPFNKSRVRGGLTKRELFAAMAMQGILSDSEYNEPVERLASSSVRAADALIAELAKSTEQKQ